MKPVLTLGEALGVLAPSTSGRIGSGSDLILRVAGSELNVAIALARLEVPVWFAGRVGDDAVGHIVRQTLLGEGVHIDYVDMISAPTGLLMKEWYGLHHEPRIYYYRRQTAMHSWDPAMVVGQDPHVDWIHVSGITFMIDDGLANRTMQWLKDWSRTPEHGISVDLNVRWRLGDVEAWRHHMAALLPWATWVFASRSELLQLWGSDQSAELQRQGVLTAQQTLIVTDGAQDAWVEQDGTPMGRTVSWTVDRIEDVVGAGDGFVGGVIAGRQRGWDWNDSLRLGALVGAFAVAHPGDWEGYPCWADITAMWDGQWVDR